MATKKGKAATKGARQIVDENNSTLQFYRYMAIIATCTYIFFMVTIFELTTLTISLAIFSGIVYTGSYKFMTYMATPRLSESGDLLDSGVDLNMEGGIAEHVKDLIILTSGVQVFSLISNYFWLLWIAVPIRGGWMLWKLVLGPWFFSSSQEQPEINEKKQRKMEKKMARRH